MAFSSRVRRITHSDRAQLDKAAQQSLLTALTSRHTTILPNLKHIRATRLGKLANGLPFGSSPSPSLHHIHLDLEFKMSEEAASSMSSYLEHAAHSPLQTLTLRGLLTSRMNDALCRMNTLSSLTLRTGPSLLPTTINALSTFPALHTLELHADHIEDIPLLDGSFPSLRSLRVRGQPEFIETLLHSIPQHQLHKLHIDLISPIVDSWDSIFHIIQKNAGHSLQDLFIEHHIESDLESEEPEAEDEDTDEVGGDSTAQTSTSSNNNTSADRPRIAVTSLGHLPKLTKLVLDTSSAIAISTENDADRVSGLWPNIVHLDLGIVHYPGQPAFSWSSLVRLTSKLPSLEYLRLPIDTEAAFPQATLQSSSMLQELYISPPIDSAEDVCGTNTFLNSTFPLLQDYCVDSWPNFHL